MTLKKSVMGALGAMILSLGAHAANNGVIAYSGRDHDGYQNIFYVNPDGTGVVQRTFGPDNGLPSWSPDGGSLAYVHRDAATSDTSIYVMHTDGSGAHAISDGDTPTWSPSGAWIAYSSRKTGTAEIWIMHPDGSAPRQLTDGPGLPKLHPAWSPDSQTIVYAQLDPAERHVSLWMTGVADADPHQLTTGAWVNYDADAGVINTANDAHSPNWNPSGGKILFWAGVKGWLGQIWAINPDGSGRVQLTKERGSNNDDPAWSPDGTRILFSTNRSVSWFARRLMSFSPTSWISRPFSLMRRFGQNPSQEMWVMQADGSGQRKVIDNNSSALPGHSAWQPIP